MGCWPGYDLAPPFALPIGGIGADRKLGLLRYVAARFEAGWAGGAEVDAMPAPGDRDAAMRWEGVAFGRRPVEAGEGGGAVAAGAAGFGVWFFFSACRRISSLGNQHIEKKNG
jgi:hypothetical protein